MDLDPVEDKEMIEMLKQDQEIEVDDGLIDDLEPKQEKLVADKSKEPEVKKAEKIEKDNEIADLKKVARTENELMSMVALAKLNGVDKLEISEKLMAHYNRQDKEVPNYFWYQNLMLIKEGKTEAVLKELNRELY